MFDLSDPEVRAAVIPALIALGGVLLAAAAGFGGVVWGAHITAKAARESARISQEESQANRQEAREADERRHQREIDQWRRERGVAAAEAILDLMNELDLGMFSFWRRVAKRKEPGDQPSPSQKELEPYFNGITRHAAAIADVKVRETMKLVATSLYGYDQIETWGGGRASEIFWHLRDDTEAVLGAFIRGDDIPDALETQRLNEALKDYWETTSSKD